MSIAQSKIRGIVYWNSRRTFSGFTLLTPIQGSGAWLIDMRGRVVHQWEIGYSPGYCGELLPNGNLLYAGRIADHPFDDMDGAGGVLLEVDWNGKVVWKYADPYLHDGFFRMQNGNTLVLRWVEVPEKISNRAAGYDTGTERKGIMWGDAIQEIAPDGRVIWEWIAHEHMDSQADQICPICPRNEWTHANACVELPDGNILVSLMKLNTLAIIDKTSGMIKWRWGPGILAHQHSPSVLDNGNILVFNNGYHQNGPAIYSSVLEINPDTNTVVWSYAGGEGTPMYFFSSTMSSCQRLPNGNTFICEGLTGRLFEVSPGGELVWEFVNPLPFNEPPSAKAKPCSVYAAYRYGMDYSGLKRNYPVNAETQTAPGTPAVEEKGSDRPITGNTMTSPTQFQGY
jgi:hypothetical protein